MITMNGQKYLSKFIPANQDIPAMIIIMPMISPTIAPPWGSPKHSSSARLRSCLQAGRVPKLAPHLTHATASSSFLVPHFVQ
jgi:hypothetical protein